MTPRNERPYVGQHGGDPARRPAPPPVAVPVPEGVAIRHLWYGFGRATVAHRVVEQGEHRRLEIGVAFCSARNNFSKQRGRAIALTALQSQPFAIDMPRAYASKGAMLADIEATLPHLLRLQRNWPTRWGAAVERHRLSVLSGIDYERIG